MLNIDAITKDPDIIKKLAVGGLLAFTGFGLIIVAGWMIEATRRVIQENDDTLPEFDDWGGYLTNGLKLTALGFIWMLPIILVIIVVAGFAISSPALFASEEDAVTVILLLNFCVIGLTFLYIIPVSFLITASVSILADTGSLKAALNPKTSFMYVKANPSGYFVSLLLGYVVSTVLGMIGTILCFIGVFPASALSYAMMGQLYGKAHKQAKENLGLAGL